MTMIKLIILILLLTTFSSNASSERIKIFNSNGEIEVGLNLTCPFNGLSQITNPNAILTRNSNEFEIILSLPEQDISIICSPLPPEFIDPLRDYFYLGYLETGDYSIIVRYVGNDEIIPPLTGIQIFEFSQLDFHITKPITVPIFDWFGFILLISIVITIARFVMIRRNIIVNPN